MTTTVSFPTGDTTIQIDVITRGNRWSLAKIGLDKGMFRKPIGLNRLLKEPVAVILWIDGIPSAGEALATCTDGEHVTFENASWLNGGKSL